MNTSMTGIRWFSKILACLCFGQNSLSIARVKTINADSGQKQPYYVGENFQTKAKLRKICEGKIEIRIRTLSIPLLQIVYKGIRDSLVIVNHARDPDNNF